MLLGLTAGVQQAYAEAAGQWQLIGTFNGWSAQKGLDTIADGVVAQDLVLDAGREYQFKLYQPDANLYMGNDGLMTQAHCTGWGLSATAGNIGIATTIAGTYHFEYNISSMALTVTYPEKEGATLYGSAVRDENTDVMIQAYYWTHGKDADGNDDGSLLHLGYGEVDWKSLNDEATELAEHFDLVWLAPSQKTADWTGFIPVNYSDQNSRAWGSEQELRDLIGTLHKEGAKVVADVVLNHAIADEKRDEGYEGQVTNFCQFEPQDFGRYGRFYPDWSWVSNTDELFLSYNDRGSSVIDRDTPGNSCGSYYADGSLEADETTASIYNGSGYKNYTWARGEYDFRIGRDWAHRKDSVRIMSRAYLTWLRDELGYDGFRYDFCKGFHPSHLNDYNRAAAPYFSVAEVFDGDVNKIMGVLRDANYNTSIFDFPTRYQIKDAVSQPRNLHFLYDQHPYMLIHKDPAHRKNAVVFCENHDSFRESYNLCGTPDASVETLQGQQREILQANAYVLTMPGVPSVFYPHWKTFPKEINSFIEARKKAGVHSESALEDWKPSNQNEDWYTARTQGKYGYMQVKLGSDCSPKSEPYAAPDGLPWHCAYADENVGVYYTSSLLDKPKPEPEVKLDTTMYVAGTFTSWAAEMKQLPCSVTLVAGDSIFFKQVRVVTTYEDGVEVRRDTTWYGQKNQNAGMTRGNSAWLLDGGYNVLLEVDVTGEYGFALVNGIFTVSYPDPCLGYKALELSLDTTVLDSVQMPFFFHGVPFSETGVQLDTLRSRYGCDSVYRSLKVIFEHYTAPVITLDTTMYVAGTFTDWATGMKPLPYTAKLTEGDTAAFKQVRVVTTYADGVEVRRDTTWYGQKNQNAGMTRGNSAWLLDGGYNVLLEVDVTGEYLFDLVDDIFTVSFPDPCLLIKPVYQSLDTTVLDSVQLPYVFYGLSFMETGMQQDTLRSRYGCDSVYRTVKVVFEHYEAPVVTFDTVMYVAGTFTDWADGMKPLPYTAYLTTNNKTEFKQVRVITTYEDGVEIRRDTTWYGQKTDGASMTRGNSAWLLDGGNNVLLEVDAPGAYVFALDGDIFTVTYPEKLGTALDEQASHGAAVKVLRADGVYILRGGRRFTILGRPL